MMIDGEEDMQGDEADYWIMWKAQRERACVNVYFRGQSIWIAGRPLDEPTKNPNPTASAKP